MSMPTPPPSPPPPQGMSFPPPLSTLPVEDSDTPVPFMPPPPPQLALPSSAYSICGGLLNSQDPYSMIGSDGFPMSPAASYTYQVSNSVPSTSPPPEFAVESPAAASVSPCLDCALDGIIEAFGKDTARVIKDYLPPYQVAEMASDRRRSQGLRILLSLEAQIATSYVSDAVFTYLHQFMTDPVASQVFQTCIKSSSTNRVVLCAISALAADKDLLLSVTKDHYGCFSINNLISVAKKKAHWKLGELVRAIAKHTCEVMTTKNGRDLIKACVLNARSYHGSFFNKAKSQCLELAKHKDGCCLLQFFISTFKPPQTQPLIDEITKNCLSLSQNNYGNFVVQYVIGREVPYDNYKILHKLKDHFVELAMHEFGSRVVEKCLESRLNDHVLEELQEADIIDLAQDPYANYVLKTALDHAEDHYRDRIVSEIQKNAKELKFHPIGRNVYNKAREFVQPLPLWCALKKLHIDC